MTAEQQETSWEYTQSKLPTGVMILEPFGASEGAGRVIRQAAAARNVFLLVNYRHGGLERPESVDGSSDLFAKAPEDIRDQHSLHLIPLPNANPHEFDNYQSLKDADAVSILFSKKSQDELTDDIKFVFSWFVQPSILKFHLTNGTPHLAKQILAAVDAVLAEPPNEEGWWLIANPDNCPGWEELGLEKSSVGG